MSTKKITAWIRPRPSKKNIRYYDVTLELGKDTLTGKRKRVTFRCDSTDRRDAEKMRTIKLAEYYTDDILIPSEKNVRQFLEEFLRNYVQNQVSPSTYKDYSENINRYLIPEFGNCRLQDLKKEQIQIRYNQWKVKSPASDKPLRAETIKHINRAFKAALNVAVEWGYLKKNPTVGVRVGKDIVTKRIEVFSTDEIRALKKAVRRTDMELPVSLLFDCVMRRGELLGLRFEDVNFDENTVAIRHSLVESADYKNPVLKDCKTDGSYRKMVVSKETMNLLKQQELKCKKICLQQGKRFTGKQHVVCKENAEPYRPNSFTSKWQDTLKKCGIRHIKLHGTRHSAISWLLSQGIPLHIVQNRAGHQDPKITLSVYSHVAKEDENRVANLLDNTLFRA